MTHLLVKPFLALALNAAALYLLADLIDGISYSGGMQFLVLGGLLLTIINFTVKPLLKILSLPIAVLTGGLFYVLINVLVLWFVSYFFDVAAYNGLALSFENAGTYVIGALVFGVINWAQSLIL